MAAADDSGSPESASRSSGRARRFVPVGINIVLIVLLILVARHFGFGTPGAAAIAYTPAPDTAQYVLLVRSVLEGERLLITVGNEYHPSRYAFIHPSLVAAWGIITRTGLDGVASYSFAAILAGAVMLMLALGRLGVGPVIRWIAIAMIVLSPLLYKAGSHFMQEPTLFLFFGAVLLFWDDQRRGRVALAGALCGILYAMRPTFLPLPVALALLGSERALIKRNSLVMAGAFVATVAVVWVIQYAVTGYGQLTGHTYWNPEIPTFSLGGAGITALFQPNAPFLTIDRHGIGQAMAIEHVRDDFLGLNRSVTALGPVAMTNILILAVGSLFITSGATRRVLLAIMAFAAANITLHTYYTFYDERFFIASFAAILFAAAVGFSELLKRATSRAGKHQYPLAGYLFLTVFLLFPGMGLPVYRPDDSQRAMHELAVARAQRDHVGVFAGRLVYPTFVAGISSSEARLMLETRVPIFWAIQGAVFDGDMLFNAVTAPPRRHVIESDILTSRRAFAISLYTIEGELDTPLIRDIVHEHGGLHLLAWHPETAGIEDAIRHFRGHYAVHEENFGHVRFLTVTPYDAEAADTDLPS